jgi:hypothetical protein
MDTPPKPYSIRASQEMYRRSALPEWMHQLPWLRFPPPIHNFQLIDPAELDMILKTARPEDAKRVREDIEFLDKEVLRLFRDRDYDAKFHLNRYRLYQLFYAGVGIVLVMLALLIMVSINQNSPLVTVLSFIGTLLALTMTYLATVSGREAPVPLYLENRRKAELLRREYFRYLMNLSPYDGVEGYERRRLVSVRAANVNRGLFPE